MSTAPLPRYLPGEIEDLIIASVSRPDSHSEKALRACALVCKSWVPASRHNLLAEGVITISPNPRDVQSLLDILQSPFCTIKPYITTLRIWGRGNRDSWNATWQALPQIHSLIPFTGICLYGPLVNSGLMHNDGNAPWPFIKRVRLVDVWKSDYTALLTFLSSLPALEELVVAGCWQNSYTSLHELTGTPNPFPALRRLDVDQDTADDVCRWLLRHGGSPSTISSIRVCQLWGLDDDYELHDTIDLVGSSSIREVELHFNERLMICHSGMCKVFMR